MTLLASCAAGPGTVGAVIGQQRDGRLFLRDVPRDLAAYGAGLRQGDEVILIDGRDVRRMTPEQVHAALSGEVGETVKLTVLRGERVIRVTVKRSPARRLPKPGPAP
jgi:C-terminal processing protease CtpA/Prc